MEHYEESMEWAMRRPAREIEDMTCHDIHMLLIGVHDMSHHCLIRLLAAHLDKVLEQLKALTCLP